MNAETPPQAPDHTVIRSELEATRLSYHNLLSEIPLSGWEAPTANPAWNVRQVMYHIVMAVRMTPQDVKLIQSGRFVSPPAWLFNWINTWITRLGARRHTPQSLAAAYDEAHNTLLGLLEELTVDQLSLSGKYPNVGGYMTGGEQTIADILHFLPLHFKEHESDVRQALAAFKERTP